MKEAYFSSFIVHLLFLYSVFHCLLSVLCSVCNTDLFIAVIILGHICGYFTVKSHLRTIMAMKRWSLNNCTSDAELPTSTKNGLLMFVLQCVLWMLGLLNVK